MTTALDAQLEKMGSGAVSWKRACLMCSTTNITLSGLQTITGVEGAAGDRVLVVGQTAGAQNGIYKMLNGGWKRTTDLSANRYAHLGMIVPVLSGTNRGLWQCVSPTTGTITLGVTSTTWQQILAVSADSTTVVLSPSGDDTGETDSAALAAALALGDVELIRDAEYYIEEPLAMTSAGSRLIGHGAHVIDGSNWVEGAVDARTNSMIQIRGAATGSVSTTLGATATKNSASLTVASGTGITDNMWLKLEGNNVADLFNGESDAEVVIEFVQVDPSYSAGTTIPLVSRTAMHHATAKPVVSYAPFIGDPMKPTVENVYLRCSGNADIAVGIEVTNAVNVRLDGISGRGFTRTLIDRKGSKNLVINDPVSRGDNNGLVYTSTCQLGGINRPVATGENGRQHDNGIPRPMLVFDDMSVGITVRDAEMKKIPGFLRTWGCILCGVDGFTLDDIDPTEIVERDTAMLVDNADGIMGSVWDSGIADIANAAFGFANFVLNGRATGFSHPSSDKQFALYPHDALLTTIASVELLNKGNSAWTAGSYFNGVLISDANGEMTDVQIHGAFVALQTKNFDCRFDIKGLTINGSPGEGSQGNVGLNFDHEGGAGTSPKFGIVTVANVSSPFGFTTNFTGAPDHDLQIEYADFDGKLGRACRAVNYTSGAVGTVMRVTGGSPEAAAEASGPHRSNAISMGAPSNNWGFLAWGQATAKHTGTAAVKGDLLVADASGNLIVNNTPQAAGMVYRALRASSGGYVEALPLSLVVTAYGAITATAISSASTLSLSGSTYIAAAAPDHYVDGNFNVRDTDGNPVNLSVVAATGLVTIGPTGGTPVHRINGATQSTVGAAGGASAPPATPSIYLVLNVGGTEYVFAGYAKS